MSKSNKTDSGGGDGIGDNDGKDNSNNGENGDGEQSKGKSKGKAWFSDEPQGALTSIEILSYSTKPSTFEEPICDVVLKGFSFYSNIYPSNTLTGSFLGRPNEGGWIGDPDKKSWTQYIPRLTAPTVAFSLIGGTAGVSYFAYKPNGCLDQVHSPTKISHSDMYAIATRIQKLTKLDFLKCLNVALPLSSQSINIYCPPIKRKPKYLSGFIPTGYEVELDWEKIPEELKLQKPADAFYNPDVINNDKCEHFFHIDCNDMLLFREFFDYNTEYIKFNQPWIMNFFRLMLIKNITACTANIALKNENVRTLTKAVNEYYDAVHELNTNFIYDYDSWDETYPIYNFFKIKLHIDRKINTIREWYNFMMEQAGKTEHELGKSQGNKIVPTAVGGAAAAGGAAISMENKSGGSGINNVIQFLKSKGYVLGGVAGTFVGAKLLDVFFKKRIRNIIKEYPNREEIIKLVTQQTSIDLSMKNIKTLWTLLSRDPIPQSTITSILKEYANKKTYSFLPDYLDWSVATLVYFGMMYKLASYISSISLISEQEQTQPQTQTQAQLQAQMAVEAKAKEYGKESLDTQDYWQDTAKDAAQIVSQAGLVASTAGLANAAPGVLFQTSTTGGGGAAASTAGSILSNFTAPTRMAIGASIKAAIELVGGAQTLAGKGLGLLDSMFALMSEKILSILSLVMAVLHIGGSSIAQAGKVILHYLNPFFLIPILARVFATIRLTSYSFYVYVVNVLQGNPTTNPINPQIIEKGSKAVAEEFAKELHKTKLPGKNELTPIPVPISKHKKKKKT